MSWQSLFINPQRGVLRSGWRVSVFGLILLFLRQGSLLAVALIVTGGDLRQAPSRLASPAGFIMLYLLLIAAALVASAVCLRAFDRRPLRSIGYQRHAGWWRDYLIGVGLATAMISVVVGMEWLVGAASIRWSSAPASDRLYGLAASVAFFNISAVYEELISRGYPLQTLLCDVPPVWGVFVTAALFGLLHAGNPNASMLGVLNATLAGVWLAVAYLKTRSLWLCTGLHWSWNWAMNVIYGLNVSGLEGMVKSSLFVTSQTGPEWLTGGSYGPEGGLLTTVIIGLGTLFLWRAGGLTPAHTGLEALERPSDGDG